MKLKDILLEIGDASSKPYKWNMMYNSQLYNTFEFKTDLGIEYEVEITKVRIDSLENKDKVAEVLFTVNDGSFEDTNSGEMYRVMATIVDTIKHTIKIDPDIKQIRFGAVKGGKSGKGRENLYTAYIKKHLPTTKIWKKGKYVYATLK